MTSHVILNFHMNTVRPDGIFFSDNFACIGVSGHRILQDVRSKLNINKLGWILKVVIPRVIAANTTSKSFEGAIYPCACMTGGGICRKNYVNINFSNFEVFISYPGIPAIPVSGIKNTI